MRLREAIHLGGIVLPRGWTAQTPFVTRYTHASFAAGMSLGENAEKQNLEGHELEHLRCIPRVTKAELRKSRSIRSSISTLVIKAAIMRATTTLFLAFLQSLIFGSNAFEIFNRDSGYVYLTWKAKAVTYSHDE